MSNRYKIYTLVFCPSFFVLFMIGWALPIRAEQTEHQYRSTHSSAFAIVAKRVDVMANDFTYNENTNTIFISAPSSAGTNGNSIIPIDVPTATIGSPIFVGSEPNRLEVTNDGSFLYVGVDGAGAVRRVNLISGTVDIQFSLGSGFCGTFLVEDLVIFEDNPETVAISRQNTGCSPRHEGVVIYDNGVLRPKMTQDHTGSNVIEPSDVITKLYGYNNETTEFGFRHLSIDEQGVNEESVTEGLLDGFGVDIKYDEGFVYATTGTVIDPSTNTLVGTYGATGAVSPDKLTNQVFFASSEFGEPLSLKIYEMDSFLPVASAPIRSVSGSAEKLEYLTENRLALLTDTKDLYILEIIELDNQIYLPVILLD